MHRTSSISAGVNKWSCAGSADLSKAPVLEMRRLDPAGREFSAEMYLFGTDVGERVKSVRTQWEAARKAAGLPKVQLRDLRHEAGSSLDEAGVRTNYVSKILGHTNLTTTSRYLNINVRGLHRAMEKLEEHQSAKKTVAQPLHSDEESARAVVLDTVRTTEDKPMVN
jgi:hypothetical protein